MNAQAQYEQDEADYLEMVKDFQRQGHTLDCSANMAGTGAGCNCEMERWMHYDRMER